MREDKSSTESEPVGVFSLSRAEHLFEKCLDEYAQLHSCREHPRYDYLLFNLVTTVNHLFEWYLKDGSVDGERKKACIRLLNPYSCKGRVPEELKEICSKTWDSAAVNLKQEAIRKLSNKSKHFKKREQSKVQRERYPAVCGELAMQCGEPTAVCAYLYEVQIGEYDQWSNLVIVLGELLDEWRAFFPEFSRRS